ncbi:lysozyme inhibitor LprI family protein [Buttiauxella sp. WJP83]|uniref:lysozyme inhibitor LprI family protein n=1 Tax=Buttiauxella sp. WJP83 TaxID=2986951 RepID=UPI0022DD023C|nr:lysozyme inhibitor LprI family protein [Buttiauxella sp. WJP83]WBM69003.1 lysozyme inhibitor LprI family protein [Buttiauxella sp. WJP83]
MKINATQSILAGLMFAALCSQTVLAAESAEGLYKKCEEKLSTAEQRECYPIVVKQSEIELSAAEKKVRAELVELEKESEGSRSLHSVKAFDKAELAYREFRNAESNRVLTSYGSGNGGGLAAYKSTIDMNLMRIKQLSE